MSVSLTFTWWALCRNLNDVDVANYARLYEMVQLAQPVTPEIFFQHVPVDSPYWVEQMLADPEAGFYQSVFAGLPCFFFKYAGFEVVYLEEDAFPGFALVVEVGASDVLS